jgi:hypothetical protein
MIKDRPYNKPRYNLAPGDFPDMDYFRSKLAEMEFSKFAKLKPQLLEQVRTDFAGRIWPYDFAGGECIVL